MDNFISNRPLRAAVSIVISGAIYLGVIDHSTSGDVLYQSFSTQHSIDTSTSRFMVSDTCYNNDDGISKLSNSVELNNEEFEYADISHSYYYYKYVSYKTEFSTYLGQLVDRSFDTSKAFEENLPDELKECCFGKVQLKGENPKYKGTYWFNLGYIVDIDIQHMSNDGDGYLKNERNKKYTLKFVYKGNDNRWYTDEIYTFAKSTNNSSSSISDLVAKWEENIECILGYYKTYDNKYARLLTYHTD